VLWIVCWGVWLFYMVLYGRLKKNFVVLPGNQEEK